MSEPLHIIGGGMAGSEAAWTAAQAGVPVVIHEMRPRIGTFAHKTGKLAEMVCSNSFRSDDDAQNAVGLLHWEMGAAGGLLIEMARRHRLPASIGLPKNVARLHKCHMLLLVRSSRCACCVTPIVRYFS